MPLNKETYQLHGYKIELIPLTISIEIPKEFESDYKKDKFEDFLAVFFAILKKMNGYAEIMKRKQQKCFCKLFVKVKK